MKSIRIPLALALAFTTGMILLAESTKFPDFTPLTSSAGALPVDGPDEATPITLSNAKWSQRTLADRRTQNALVLYSNSGNWDMIASNETGPNAGRYLFMPFETGTAGVQRIDTQDPHYDTRTVTIVQPGTQGFVSGDVSRWTPWGGYLTAEESWGAGSVKGRLFEVTDPITAAVKATGYNRPEDIEIQTLADGTQLLYVNTTDSDINTSGSDGTSRTYNINLSTNVVRLFAAPQTTDLATGAAAGGGFRNADNLAIDHEGNMYIVEDRPGAEDDDIWFAVDLNKDGDLNDPGEGIARWVSNGTVGSEFTGLYFDLRNPNIAYVNIQHPDSGVDRTIEIKGSPNLERGNKFH